MIIVIMGVSGSGKTTIGALLAEKLKAIFADGDDFHSPANKQKMAGGQPLDDADRKPWLASLNRLLKSWNDAGTNGVLACSALKASYRESLSEGLPQDAVTFCLLQISREVLQKRLAERHHEFMTAALLDSQLATLELPEGVLTVQNDRTPAEVVEEIAGKIRA